MPTLLAALSAVAAVVVAVSGANAVETPGTRGSRLRAARGVNDSPFAYETKWFTAWVDNYNFNGASSTATYPQKYLINATYWGGPGSPIFFYAGNEGLIELFCENAGEMWWLAVQFKALLVCAEHRFYGSSMPFGNASYDNVNLGLLSSEQALADYAVLLDSLKLNLTATASPVVTFGGSYGGMLAAWFRMKYPASTVGAIAASAPIVQIPGIMDPHDYYRGANGWMDE